VFFRNRLLPVFLMILIVSVGCSISVPGASPTSAPTNPPPTPLPPQPVQPGEANPDEPVFVVGDIPYTSPFFVSTLNQPFIMLEDEAGFVYRDLEFEFPLQSQVLGPVIIHDDNSLSYDLSLPAVPQGTQVDVDNNGQQDAGVQVFAVAYWSNTWGDTFLEKRDGTGWSTAYASTITDPGRENEIVGGILVVWAPDEKQAFPTGFGPDQSLFTEDDPTGPIPAGYNLVDLNQEPFRFYKEARPNITLNEGAGAVSDYSDMSYAEAFQALIDKVASEYPFTEQKNIDWPALKEQFTPRLEQARNKDQFYSAMRDLALQIPDGHVNISFDQDYFISNYGGGLGLVLSQLSDGRIIVTQALPGDPASQAGIEPGAEIVSWNGNPVGQAIDQVVPYFAPYSTQHTHHLGQVNFLTRMPVGTHVDLGYKNPSSSQVQEVSLKAISEYDSFFATIPSFQIDQLALPLQGHILKDSGLGYIRIDTFNDDPQLMARLWDHYIQGLIDDEIPGLVIDLRSNSGGSLGIALDFAGYFFDQEITLYNGYYFSHTSGHFEQSGLPTQIKPGPKHYDGKIAVLVTPDCVSACEGFAYALQQESRSIIIGHYPTAGAFGEVGRGQYKLPDEISMQFPTGRPLSPDGEIVIEGQGVIPDILVPVTEESALGKEDALLNAAVQALQ
jgi:C-terminal processing protease CtpA/Prc